MGAHMDDCCDICGDQGVLEAIATCCRCKVSREHAYCMRICRIDPPEDWCCENCEHSDILVPKSGVMEDLPQVSSSNPSAKLQLNFAQPNKDLDLRRKISMDRVKKIQTGKVKPLSSEEVIKLSSGSKILESAVKFSVRPNSALRKSNNTSDLEKTPLKTRAIQPNSSSSLIRANRSLVPLKQMNPSRYGPGNSQINTATRAPRQEFVKEPRGNAASPNPELQTDHPGPSTKSISSVNQCPYDPTPRHCWKGSFRVMDNPKFEEDKIQAHHPSKVHRKVYEFSKKMPDVLSFELVNRNDIWVKLFPDYLPDQKNIGVYFWPSKGNRSDKYISMLEYIHAKDVGLRMFMDGTELLVFTSEVLSSDCQRWEGDYFLWGLFYRAKETKVAAGVLDSYEIHQEDMEIDMVGGLDVGKTDFVVPRTPMQQLQDPNSTNVICNNIPPGFERIHELRVGTPLPADKNNGGVTQVKIEKPDWSR